jgi:hypothetical protein
MVVGDIFRVTVGFIIPAPESRHQNGENSKAAVAEEERTAQEGTVKTPYL